MRLSEATWPQVEEYLKGNQTLIIPIGSVEQHGPTGLIGTDYFTATAIAEEISRREKIYVAPPICYGMARHHLAFPGSASLKPSTFIQVIKDISTSMIGHGFQRIFFLNGHGGNVAPLLTAFSEIKDFDVDALLKTISWYTLADVQNYENEHFGKENGFHATCGEVSLTHFTHSHAFEKITPQNFEVEEFEFQMPMSPTEYRKTFPDGRMMSNPGLANKTHGEKLFEIAVQACSKEIHKFD